MKANTLVMEEPGSVTPREISIPEIGPKEVLVRIELSGVCGTDVHMYEGGMDLDWPVVPGHEFAGVIEAIGDERTADSKGEPVGVDDAVTVCPGIVCGDCWYCNNVPARPPTCENREVYGYFNVDTPPHVYGGFSEYMIIREDASFYRLPDSIDIELGALAEPMAVATRALERSYAPGIPSVREGFGIGQSIVVQGAGPIGLLTIAAASAAGGGNIIVIDAIDERLDLAKQFGADHTVNFQAYDSTDALIDGVKGLTNGDVGPDAVIEAAGVPQAFRQGIEIVRDGGTVVEVGHFAYSGEVEINPTQIVQKDIDIFGSLVYPPSQFETSVSLLDRLADEMPFSELFNYRVGLEDAERAYEKQASGEAYRATIHPHR